MLILENLRVIENRIVANYRFDGLDSTGEIIYDIESKSVIRATFGDQNAEEVYGYSHLLRALGTMVDYNKYPSTYTYAWF